MQQSKILEFGLGSLHIYLPSIVKSAVAAMTHEQLAMKRLHEVHTLLLYLADSLYSFKWVRMCSKTKEKPKEFSMTSSHCTGAGRLSKNNKCREKGRVVKMHFKVSYKPARFS
jgi:hypothetical protein